MPGSVPHEKLLNQEGANHRGQSKDRGVAEIAQMVPRAPWWRSAECKRGGPEARENRPSCKFARVSTGVHGSCLCGIHQEVP
jgi:hypothetical protein